MTSKRSQPRKAAMSGARRAAVEAKEILDAIRLRSRVSGQVAELKAGGRPPAPRGLSPAQRLVAEIVPLLKDRPPPVTAVIEAGETITRHLDPIMRAFRYAENKDSDAGRAIWHLALLAAAIDEVHAQIRAGAR